MSLFKSTKKVGLVADIIRCDQPDYLIWKWHPDGKGAGEHKREYSIRSGSHLVVKDGEVAVFVYRQSDGTMQDFIEGPYDEKLKTRNFPVLTAISSAFFGGDTPHQAEVYFINLARVNQIKFGVPFFDVSDPRYPDFAVPVAVRGTITFKIEDYKEFIKHHRLTSFTYEDFAHRIKDTTALYVKNAVANALTRDGTPVVRIESRIVAIQQIVEENIKLRFARDFGVTVNAVDISAIEIDKSCPDYAQLMRITRDVTAEAVTSRAAADNEHYSESLRIAREEEQYARRMRTRTENIDAYRTEKGAEVGVAGAMALGEMGAAGAGAVDIGGGAGFSPAAMMASMALGGAAARTVSEAMSGAISADSAIGTTPPPITGATTPPIAKSYHVAKDGAATGPFSAAVLAEMASRGELLPETLVWCPGMSAWARADSQDELSALFPPAII